MESGKGKREPKQRNASSSIGNICLWEEVTGKKGMYGNKRRRMIADVGAIGPCDCPTRNGREEDLRCSES